MLKKIEKRFTQVYDPRKTKEGSLINEKQVILPGESGPLTLYAKSIPAIIKLIP